MVKKNNAYSLNRGVEWPTTMVLEGVKEKRGFSRKDSCSITIPSIFLFLITPMALIYRVHSWENVIGS
jgi:hypothetical protein